MKANVDCLSCEARNTFRHDRGYVEGLTNWMGKPYTCLKCGFQAAYHGKKKEWTSLRVGRKEPDPRRRSEDKKQDRLRLI